MTVWTNVSWWDILKVSDRLFTCWAVIPDHPLPILSPVFIIPCDMVQLGLCQKQLELLKCGTVSSRAMQHVSPMWCTELTAQSATTSSLFPRALSTWLNWFPTHIIIPSDNRWYCVIVGCLPWLVVIMQSGVVNIADNTCVTWTIDIVKGSMISTIVEVNSMKKVSLTCWPHITSQGRYLVLISVKRLSLLKGLSAAGRIRSIERRVHWHQKSNSWPFSLYHSVSANYVKYSSYGVYWKV
jgi:hypothetical protein